MGPVVFGARKIDDVLSGSGQVALQIYLICAKERPAALSSTIFRRSRRWSWLYNARLAAVF